MDFIGHLLRLDKNKIHDFKILRPTCWNSLLLLLCFNVVGLKTQCYSHFRFNYFNLRNSIFGTTKKQNKKTSMLIFLQTQHFNKFFDWSYWKAHFQLWLPSVRFYCICIIDFQLENAITQNKTNKVLKHIDVPKQAMFPSRPMYFRSHLAASVSRGSLSLMSSMANTAFWRYSALSSKLILASKQTTVGWGWGGEGGEASGKRKQANLQGRR